MAAISPVPRRNIEDNVRAAGAPLLARCGAPEVTISVPQGVEMARKTLNARLGILGGISILGTTGIVKPYSTSAYRASVVQGVQVATTLDHGVVVLTTGGRTEQFAMKERAGLPPACFVQMGDFLRYALDETVAQGLTEVVIGGMVGKLTKIAQGETITHANRAGWTPSCCWPNWPQALAPARGVRRDCRRRNRPLCRRACRPGLVPPPSIRRWPGPWCAP